MEPGLRVGRAEWGRGRERVGSTVVGREAVLQRRRPGEVGRPTRSTAEGRLRRKHAARR